MTFTPKPFAAATGLALAATLALPASAQEALDPAVVTETLPVPEVSALQAPSERVGEYLKAKDGARILYEAAGDGPPMLLLHGYPLSGALFARVRDAASGRVHRHHRGSPWLRPQRGAGGAGAGRDPRLRCAGRHGRARDRGGRRRRHVDGRADRAIDVRHGARALHGARADRHHRRPRRPARGRAVAGRGRGRARRRRGAADPGAHSRHADGRDPARRAGGGRLPRRGHAGARAGTRRSVGPRRSPSDRTSRGCCPRSTCRRSC